MIDVINMNAGDAKAIIDRMKGQFVGCEWDRAFTVFDVCEPFLFCRGEQMTIVNDTGGGIVKCRVYS